MDRCISQKHPGLHHGGYTGGLGGEGERTSLKKKVSKKGVDIEESFCNNNYGLSMKSSFRFIFSLAQTLVQALSKILVQTPAQTLAQTLAQTRVQENINCQGRYFFILFLSIIARKSNSDNFATKHRI